MDLAKKRPAHWSDVKAGLKNFDRQGLLDLVRDLYQASATNRRFLHARFVQSSSTLDDYRRLVRDMVFPDPFSRRPIRLREATATIAEYRRSTGDLVGSADLMVEFVEAGTEQAADLGCGDDPYFSALERKVTEVMRLLRDLPDGARLAIAGRLIRLGEYRDSIGWGYGDFLGDTASQLEARHPVQSVKQVVTPSKKRSQSAALRTSVTSRG